MTTIGTEWMWKMVIGMHDDCILSCQCSCRVAAILAILANGGIVLGTSRKMLSTTAMMPTVSGGMSLRLRRVMELPPVEILYRADNLVLQVSSYLRPPIRPVLTK